MRISDWSSDVCSSYLTTECNRQLSPTGEYLCYTHSTVSQPPQTVVVRLRDGAETLIEQADVSELLAAGYVPPAEFLTLAADGETEIHGLQIGSAACRDRV